MKVLAMSTLELKTTLIAPRFLNGFQQAVACRIDQYFILAESTTVIQLLISTF